MSNVIDFPTFSLTVTRAFCDCGRSLEYWVSDDDYAYGLCPRCDLNNAEEVLLTNMDTTWEH